MSRNALGYQEVPAYEYICQACVSTISFSYDEPSIISVSYNGSADTIRQLQTGSRIVIVTTDDNYPYPFVIGDTPPTTSQFTVQSIGIRETIFSSSIKADLLLMGAQYEISNLTPGRRYFFRTSAENSLGICDKTLSFNNQCGSFSTTIPTNIIPQQPPNAPLSLTTSVINQNSIEVKWIEPDSVSAIQSYRVDAFLKSPQASSYYSFFGDSEIQVFSTGRTHVQSGTFTIAFDSFTIQLPGTLSAYANYFQFNTTEDLTSYFESGDQFSVNNILYTVASVKYKYSWTI